MPGRPSRARWGVIAVAALIATGAGAAIAVGCSPRADPGATPSPSGAAAASETPFAWAASKCRPARGTWAVGRWPSACWRPYSSRSPFNRSIRAHPRLLPGWRGIVRRFSRLPSVALTAGADLERWGPPTYWPGRGDPVFRVHCTEPWGRCEVEGRRLRIPDAARAATGSDGHMTVVDQHGGWEYDFWRVQRKPRGGGRLDVAWGGRTRIDGDGLDSDATAARFGNLAGAVRAEELAAGRIRHALFLTVPCDAGTWVYPARKSGTSCAEDGESNVDAPPMGARFRLAMSSREIARLAVPSWKKAVLRAMARYGMYVGDTGGPTWAIEQEGSLTYTSFGRPDRAAAFARRIGAPYDPGSRSWTLDLSSGVDWARRLRVVHPCEARASC